MCWGAILGCALLGDVLPRRTIVTCVPGCIAIVQARARYQERREGSPGRLAAIYVGVAGGRLLDHCAARGTGAAGAVRSQQLLVHWRVVLVSLSAGTGDCRAQGLVSGLFYLCMALDRFAIAGIFVAFP